LDKGGVVLGSAFVVMRGASASADPGQGAFHDPALGQDLGSGLPSECRHDHHSDAEAAATSARVSL
jgi:hypothetical protein